MTHRKTVYICSDKADTKTTAENQDRTHIRTLQKKKQERINMIPQVSKLHIPVY